MLKFLEELAAALDLPLAVQSSTAELRLNISARRLIGEESVHNLVDVVRTVWRASSEKPSSLMFDAIAQRRAHSERMELRDGSAWRAFLTPLEDGSTGLMLARESRLSIEMDDAATWCHEISNAMGAALGWIQLARRKPELLDRALHHIEASSRTTQAASERVTKRFRRSSNTWTTRANHDPLNFSAFLNDLVDRLRPSAERVHVTILPSIEEGLWINAEAEQVWSMVWNLAKNALEAFESGQGRVEVIARREGDKVNLLVRDDGPGIPSDVQDKILHPYFTTKASGTGLGLPLVKRIAESLGGQISLQSQVGIGTTITIYLPFAEDEAKPDFGTESPSGVLGLPTLRGLKILVVDDEPAVRELVATALELRGAQVKTVSGLSEVAQLRQHFDIAVVDLTLQDGSGTEVVVHLRQHGLAQAVLLCSGVDLEVESPMKPRPLIKPDAWLRKPFELEELVFRVRSLVAEVQEQHGGAKAH